MSGMLLYQSIIFGDKYEEDSFELRPLPELNDDDVAILLHSFQDGKVSKKIITVKNIPESVEMNPNAVKWYHLTSMTVLANLMAHLRVPLHVITLFGDTTFRNRHKTTADGAIIMSIMSLCLFDGLTCAKKMILYTKGNIVVTLEHRIVSSVSTMVEEDQSLLSKRSSLPRAKGHSANFTSLNPLSGRFDSSEGISNESAQFSQDSGENNMLKINLAEQQFRESPNPNYGAAVLTDLINRCAQDAFAKKVRIFSIFSSFPFFHLYRINMNDE